MQRMIPPRPKRVPPTSPPPPPGAYTREYGNQYSNGKATATSKGRLSSQLPSLRNEVPDPKTMATNFRMTYSHPDDPKTTSILRGANILREQLFGDQRANQHEKEEALRGRQRLFHTQDEEVLHDLLKLQPWSENTTPCDTMVSFSKEDAHEILRKTIMNSVSCENPESDHKATGPSQHLRDTCLPAPWEHDLNLIQPTQREKVRFIRPRHLQERQKYKDAHSTSLASGDDWQLTAALPALENAVHWANLSSNHDNSFVSASIVDDGDSFATLAKGPSDKQKLSYAKNNREPPSSLSSHDLRDFQATRPQLIGMPMEDAENTRNLKVVSSSHGESARSDLNVEASEYFLGSASLEDPIRPNDLGGITGHKGVQNPLQTKSNGYLGIMQASIVADVQKILNHASTKDTPNNNPNISSGFQSRGQHALHTMAAKPTRKKKHLKRQPAHLQEHILCGDHCANFESEDKWQLAPPLEDDACSVHSFKSDSKNCIQPGSKKDLGIRNPSPKRLSCCAETSFALHNNDRFDILSPGSERYNRLQEADEAFRHAMNAGSLWQSIVGQHVRFPQEWWQGRGYCRTAPLGCNGRIAAIRKWVYYDRHRIKGDIFLNEFVPTRDSPGRLLLHIVVQDFMTARAVLDIAVGTFHPNAKSVRTTETANKRVDDCRDVWMATRLRTEEGISVIDPRFLSGIMGESQASPLGGSTRRIGNHNVRSIYGESPPIRTMFVAESTIYEILAGVNQNQNGPADALLRRYMYTF